MKLHIRKTHTITFSQSRTLHPPLTFCGLELEVSNLLKLLGVTLDNKITFEKRIRNLPSSIAPKIWFYSQMLQDSRQ